MNDRLSTIFSLLLQTKFVKNIKYRKINNIKDLILYFYKYAYKLNATNTTEDFFIFICDHVHINEEDFKLILNYLDNNFFIHTFKYYSLQEFKNTIILQNIL